MGFIVLADIYNLEALAEGAEYLRSQGHQVEGTDDGSKVMSLLTENKVDILMIPGVMQGVDGFEILHYLTTTCPSPPKVVFVTIVSEYGTPRTFWNASIVCNFLLSPYTSWQLVLCIEQLLYRDISMARIAPQFGEENHPAS